MHFCEMRATPHLTNESEIESKNKIKRRQRNNNQNVAPASSSSSQQQQQLKIRSKMRQPAPLSCTVGNIIMRQLPQLQLQLPLLVLLCAGLNGLTHVAALKGKLQLHLPQTIPPSPLWRAPREIWLTISAHSALVVANGQQILCGNAALPRFPRYLLVSFVVFPFSQCLPHLVVPRFGYFWLQPTALLFFIYAARSLMDFNVAL